MATIPPIEVKLFTIDANGEPRHMTFEEVAKLLNTLSFNEYQEKAVSTAIYPPCAVSPNSVGESNGGEWIYPLIGLCGEVGEVAEKVKKIIRDKHGFVEDADREAIGKEIGDVLWYLAALCKEFNLNLQDVAQKNLDKLADRKARGTLGGSGDNR
jgi:NTP pyrophosphatase (non-canonical NTP hydrolase)